MYLIKLQYSVLGILNIYICLYNPLASRSFAQKVF